VEAGKTINTHLLTLNSPVVHHVDAELLLLESLELNELAESRLERRILHVEIIHHHLIRLHQIASCFLISEEERSYQFGQCGVMASRDTGMGQKCGKFVCQF